MQGEQGEQHQSHVHAHGHDHAASTSSVREERQPALDEATEIAPGIIRVQLPISLPGLGHVNCYALPDSKGIALVDPGLPGPGAWKELRRRLAAADLPVERVHTVVVTHSHPDHFGQAGRFREDYGAKVITHRLFRTFFDPDEEPDEIAVEEIDTSAPTNAHVASMPPLDPAAPRMPWSGPMPWGQASSSPGGNRRSGAGRGPGRPPWRRRLQYRLMRGVGGRMGAVPTPTERIEDATRLDLGGRSWVSLHTPGHTNDHLCLLDPEAGILISGDHVLPTITPHISGVGPIVDPLDAFFRSLDKVGELDGITQVLPAHGLPFDDLGGRAGAIRRHHEDRLQLLRDASADWGWGTVPDYTRKLFPERSYGQMADSETYAHLEHLRLTGKAEVRDDGEDLLYLVGDSSTSAA
jgi:glyoxylase-like metal-dependent hydrolase (beta-lactamase superfamily II)